jgi:F-type H+-transporting ATPase subunit gamma
MATLRDIRKRIGSVKNTQKITKAMKMVAAAKLRRAQTAVVGARPYAMKLKDVVAGIVAKSTGTKNPLFAARDSAKVIEVLVFTSNRGLCGGFNSNLLRKTDPFLKDLRAQGATVRIVSIGKKARDYFNARKTAVAETILPWADKLTFNETLDLTAKTVERFLSGEIDAYYLVYNKFISAMTQQTTMEKLLPINLETTQDKGGVDYIYEPAKMEILTTILPKFLATQVYKAHLESLASELGARMSAMDSATNNASDMIGKLTLKYNRARQAAITTELMDIVNGAESLK